MKRLILTILLFFISAVSSRVSAGGPLLVHDGMAVSYHDKPFIYRYDQGNLGQLSNSQAIALIEQLINQIRTVSTVSIKLQPDNPIFLKGDITANTLNDVLPEGEDFIGFTPIIFDSDGSVINSLLGGKASNSVLGVGGPSIDRASPDEIPESIAIFNGKFINGIKTSEDRETDLETFKTVILHEFCHALGLDHSQINIGALRLSASQSLRDSVPLMFPVLVNKQSAIKRDDISSLSFLYPNETVLKGFGKIKGRVLKQDRKTPVLGTNVIARNIDKPDLEAVSSVSDFLEQKNGSYNLFALPPGKYTIEIEPINPSFIAGSGVGPYTMTSSDKSFEFIVPKGFYAGPDMLISKSGTFVVEVMAGDVIRDANIIIPELKEKEPNDSIDTANSLSVPNTISGEISSSETGSIEIATLDSIDTLSEQKKEEGLDEDIDSENLFSGEKSTTVLSDFFSFYLNEPTTVTVIVDSENKSETDLFLDIGVYLFNSNATKIFNYSDQGISHRGSVIFQKLLESGFYVFGLGAKEGLGSYKLSVSAAALRGQDLSINPPDEIIFIEGRDIETSLTVKGFNLHSRTRCNISSETDEITFIPAKFSLDERKNIKEIKVTIPFTETFKKLVAKSSGVIKVTVTCDNDTIDDAGIFVSKP